MSYSAFIKDKLLSLINEMLDQYHWLFTQRERFQDQEMDIWRDHEIYHLSMEGKSLKDELLEI